MSEKNGKTVVVPAQKSEDRERYRPTADRENVHREIERAMRDVVYHAAHEAVLYMSLVLVDRDQDVAVRYGHAVDARECLELALDYLGLLMNELNHQIRVKNDPRADIH